jgi:hypothetical protein
MAVVIDPSELRSSSKLKKYLIDVDYKPLPGLEARTGADIMISPDGLLFPKNDNLLQHHIEQGAKLLQVKFGHDLAQSVADERLDKALLRMIEAGANPWQCLLTFIGTFGIFSDGLAKINGQKTFGYPMTWKRINSALIGWSEKGGSLDAPVSSGKMLKEHFENHQRKMNNRRAGKVAKLVWPDKTIIFNEIDKNQSLLKQWTAATELKPVDDFRVLLCTIPGAKIGPERATAIYEWMHLNGKKMSFYGFLEVLGTDELLEVAGIGKGTLEAIQRGLNDDALQGADYSN